MNEKPTGKNALTNPILSENTAQKWDLFFAKKGSFNLIIILLNNRRVFKELATVKSYVESTVFPSVKVHFKNLKFR